MERKPVHEMTVQELRDEVIALRAILDYRAPVWSVPDWSTNYNPHLIMNTAVPINPDATMCYSGLHFQ